MNIIVRGTLVMMHADVQARTQHVGGDRMTAAHK